KGRFAHLGFNPGGRRGVEVLPNFFLLVPNQGPGMSIALTHQIFVPDRFVDRIADRVPRRNVRSAQEQDGGGSEVFAMAAAPAQEESAQWGFVGAGEIVSILPGTICKIVAKKTTDGLDHLVGSFAGEL